MYTPDTPLSRTPCTKTNPSIAYQRRVDTMSCRTSSTRTSTRSRRTKNIENARKPRSTTACYRYSTRHKSRPSTRHTRSKLAHAMRCHTYVTHTTARATLWRATSWRIARELRIFYYHCLMTTTRCRRRDVALAHRTQFRPLQPPVDALCMIHVLAR